MALGKQAKVLSRAQIEGALGYIAKTGIRYEIESYSCCQLRRGFARRRSLR